MSVSFAAALRLMQRDLSLSFGRGGGPFMSVSFYLILLAMIPLSLGPDRDVLRQIAAGLGWLCLALTSLLSLERLFERDYEAGMFDIVRLGPLPLEAIGGLKAFSQWLGSGLFLSLMTPFVIVILGADISLAAWSLVTALMGSLSFAIIGAFGASLTLGSRKGGLLICVLVLPLYVPPVIFGAGALSALGSGQSPFQGLALLGAFTLSAVALGPLAIGAGLRTALA
jgi:heme exporter protein B